MAKREKNRQRMGKWRRESVGVAKDRARTEEEGADGKQRVKKGKAGGMVKDKGMEEGL